jgi:hypothetical protein
MITQDDITNLNILHNYISVQKHHAFEQYKSLIERHEVDAGFDCSDHLSNMDDQIISLENVIEYHQRKLDEGR